MLENPKDMIEKQLIDIIMNSQNGCKLSEILEVLPSTLSRRTIQRHLQALKKQKHINTRGEKSGVVYVIAENTSQIPLSPEARKQKTLLSRPLIHRTPVPYHPDFLFSYEPNKTFYLFV